MPACADTAGVAAYAAFVAGSDTRIAGALRLFM